MRFKDGKEITIRYYGTKLLIAARKGVNLIWSAVRSCFGSGGWKDDKAWKDDEGWKD